MLQTTEGCGNVGSLNGIMANGSDSSVSTQPAIPETARRATKCVQVLLDYRADPRMTMSVPLTGPHGTRARGKRRATAMDLATAHPASPEIVALLTNALESTTANRKQR